MLVTLLGMIVLWHPAISLLVEVSIIALHPSRESYTVFSDDTVIEEMEEQPTKTLFPMLVTLLGMEIEVREVQSQKAQSLMSAKPSGKDTDVREVQP